MHCSGLAETDCFWRLSCAAVYRILPSYQKAFCMLSGPTRELSTSHTGRPLAQVTGQLIESLALTSLVLIEPNAYGHFRKLGSESEAEK